LVIISLLLAIATSREDHFDQTDSRLLAVIVTVIGFVVNDRVEIEGREQRFGLGDVIVFSACQDEA
jgi:hypothetical protein